MHKFVFCYCLFLVFLEIHIINIYVKFFEDEHSVYGNIL